MISLGATFSHRHLSQIGCNPKDALATLLTLPFSWVRLGCYMDQPNWDEMANYLNLCEQNQINVVLTIGQKAPRWPEFYLPPNIMLSSQSQIDQEVLEFIATGVQKFKHFSCLKVWQVENEPLDPSGPDNQSISAQFLISEINLVKKLDSSRPLMVNFWANKLIKRNLMGLVADHIDIIGLDIYYQVPGKLGRLFGPDDSNQQLTKYLAQFDKPIWITELQAEPWGNAEVTPQQVANNLKKVIPLNPQVILIWGYEYWYQQKQIGNTQSWHDYLKNIFEFPTNHEV